VTPPDSPQLLSAIMGALCQQKAEGTLHLEQNDGTRRIHLAGGKVIYLQSDVAGEQFGNYLLRQGILDFSSLNELLANDEGFRLGEKVIQWGLMSTVERDLHLSALQEQVMIHALEHQIVQMEWKPGEVHRQLSDDLRFEVNHRQFVWSTFIQAHNVQELCDLFYQQKEWRWSAQGNLLDDMSDLPLTPQLAYSLSFLGQEPMGFETFLSLSNLPEEEAARLFSTLWALGVLTLTQGTLPGPMGSVATPAPKPKPLVLEAPTPLPPIPPPSQPLPPTPSALPPLDFLPKIELDTEQPGNAFPEFGAIPAMAEATPARSEDNPSIRARKFFLRAKNLLIQDRTVEAIRLLEQSVQMDPDSDQAYEPWLLLGKHRLTNPAWSTRAIEALQSASRLKPKAAEPWALMGEVYHRKEFRANAKACFKKAMELDPSLPIPDDIDLHDEAPEPVEGRGLFSRFRSILGGKD